MRRRPTAPHSLMKCSEPASDAASSHGRRVAGKITSIAHGVPSSAARARADASTKSRSVPKVPTPRMRAAAGARGARLGRLQTTAGLALEDHRRFQEEPALHLVERGQRHARRVRRRRGARWTRRRTAEVRRRPASVAGPFPRRRHLAGLVQWIPGYWNAARLRTTRPRRRFGPADADAAARRPPLPSASTAPRPLLGRTETRGAHAWRCAVSRRRRLWSSVRPEAALVESPRARSPAGRAFGASSLFGDAREPPCLLRRAAPRRRRFRRRRREGARTPTPPRRIGRARAPAERSLRLIWPSLHTERRAARRGGGPSGGLFGRSARVDARALICAESEPPRRLPAFAATSELFARPAPPGDLRYVVVERAWTSRNLTRLTTCARTSSETWPQSS